MGNIKVIFGNSDSNNDWAAGDVGYIIGFLSNDNVPYYVVVVERTKMPVLVQFGANLEVIIN